MNDVTGDAQRTKPSTDLFRTGYDAIDWSKPSTDTNKQVDKSNKEIEAILQDAEPATN